MFLVLALAVGMAAVKTQVSLLFGLFGVLLGAVLASMLMARQMVRSVTLKRELSERIWQNQTAHLAYYLRNLKWQGSCMAIAVEEVAPQGLQSAGGYCVHLPARQLFRAGGRIVCHRRGRIVLRRLKISTTFPFGLLQAYRFIDQEAAVIVWPARGRLRRQLLRHGAVQTSRLAPSPVSGGQDEFFGLREYHDDDNPRWIHWRKSAGRPAPVIREMSRPLPEVLWIVLDSHMPDQASREHREQAIRLAATLADHAFARQYHVGLLTSSGGKAVVLRHGQGRGQRRALLDALAGIDHQTLAIEQVLAAIDRRQVAQAQVVLITGSDQASLARTLGPLRGACRYLSVLDRGQFGAVFEDDPLAQALTENQPEVKS